MAIRVVRLGTPRTRGEGLRVGTVRRLPRGVRKTDTDFSVGCYCEDAAHCHRRLLCELLREAGAVIA